MITKMTLTVWGDFEENNSQVNLQTFRKTLDSYWYLPLKKETSLIDGFTIF